MQIHLYKYKRCSYLVKICLSCFALLFSLHLQAQVHDHLINYYSNAVQVNGMKIKTNLPFSSGSQMPTVHIYGFSYSGKTPIDLTIVYYIYNGAFINYSVSSTGAYTPPISLSNEGGKVVIFINDKPYCPRFTVSVYANGRPAESNATYFQGWTVVDEPLNGLNTVSLPYRNKFNGDTYLVGGIWNAAGKVGIGTTTPAEALSVNGNIVAKEVKVIGGDWPDYVFEKDYPLLPLNELGRQINDLGHLPEMPSASEVKASGQSLGEMNKMLLKKVEELTLYLLQQQKEIKAMHAQIQALESNTRQ